MLNDRDSDFLHFQINHDFAKSGSRAWKKVDLHDMSANEFIHFYYERLEENVAEIVTYEKQLCIRGDTSNIAQTEPKLAFIAHFKSAAPHVPSAGILRYTADRTKIRIHMRKNGRGKGERWF